MTNPYPLPRQTRETAPIAGDGRSTYGPFAFRIWDAEDVIAEVSRAGKAYAPEAVTIQKVAGQPFDYFTATFAAALRNGDKAVLQGRRLHERAIDVLRGGVVVGNALERELTAIGTVLQELRRDADRALSGDHFGGGSSGGDLGISDIAGLKEALEASEQIANKNRANGYVGLGANGKLSKALLPDLGGGGAVTVATRSDLAGSPTGSGIALYLAEAGREGMWLWREGDYAARVAADPRQAQYVASSTVSAGLGCWVRAGVEHLQVTRYGAVPATKSSASENASALRAAIDTASASGGGEIVIPAGTWHLDSKVDKTLQKGGVRLSGAGPDVTRLVFTKADGGVHLTYPDDGWWFDGMAGVAHLSDLSLVTTQPSGGVAFSINGRTVGGRPMEPTTFENVRLRGDAADTYWTTAIDLLDVSLSRFDTVQVFNAVADPSKGTGFSIRSSGSGRDPVEHLLNNCGVTYGAAAVQAGSYVEGIQINNAVFVATDYGVYWDASATAESHLGLVNSHINARRCCVALARVHHSLIQGNLFFIQASDTSVGVSLNSVGETDISHNVLRGNGGNTAMYIEDKLGEMAIRRLSIGRNLLAGFQTGYLIAADAQNVVLNEADQVFQQVNTPIINNSGKSLYPSARGTPRGGTFSHAGGVSLSADTERLILWGSIVQQDNPGNSMADGIWRAPEAGVYMFAASINLNSNPGADTKSFLFAKYNGNETAAITECWRNGGSPGRMNLSLVRWMNAGDTMQFTVNPGNVATSTESGSRNLLHVRKIG
ncbi:hypothetical protein [Aureimonas sp. D3]|uniref:hypothetical protein n=1 Tax=Aureimonas sp. D3 TaxID=1638164 RepID=UPI0007841CB3|nr:hypothetical protein [Aureimonas sp. D3]